MTPQEALAELKKLISGITFTLNDLETVTKIKLAIEILEKSLEKKTK